MQRNLTIDPTNNSDELSFFFFDQMIHRDDNIFNKNTPYSIKVINPQTGAITKSPLLLNKDIIKRPATHDNEAPFYFEVISDEPVETFIQSNRMTYRYWSEGYVSSSQSQWIFTSRPGYFDLIQNNRFDSLSLLEKEQQNILDPLRQINNYPEQFKQKSYAMCFGPENIKGSLAKLIKQDKNRFLDLTTLERLTLCLALVTAVKNKLRTKPNGMINLNPQHIHLAYREENWDISLENLPQILQAPFNQNSLYLSPESYFHCLMDPKSLIHTLACVFSEIFGNDRTHIITTVEAFEDEIEEGLHFDSLFHDHYETNALDKVQFIQLLCDMTRDEPTERTDFRTIIAILSQLKTKLMLVEALQTHLSDIIRHKPLLSRSQTPTITNKCQTLSLLIDSLTGRESVKTFTEEEIKSIDLKPALECQVLKHARAHISSVANNHHQITVLSSRQ